MLRDAGLSGHRAASLWLASGILLGLAGTAATEDGLREGRSVLSDEWKARVEASKAASEAYQANAVSTFMGLRVARPTGSPLKPASYLDDPTLRAGDIVMASDGLKVFSGPPGIRHRANDFVQFDRVGATVSAHGPELRAISALPREIPPAPVGAAK